MDGDRQLFYLPEEWLKHYWQGEPPASAYLALLPPHPRDTEEEFAPCKSPARIVMGYVGRDNAAHEQILLCVDFCNSTSSGRLLQGLWGRYSRLVSVEVTLLEDGRVDLEMHFRRVASSAKNAKNAGAPPAAEYEGAESVRHLRVNGPRKEFRSGEAGSCLERE